MPSYTGVPPLPPLETTVTVRRDEVAGAPEDPLGDTEPGLPSGPLVRSHPEKDPLRHPHPSGTVRPTPIPSNDRGTRDPRDSSAGLPPTRGDSYGRGRCRPGPTPTSEPTPQGPVPVGVSGRGRRTRLSAVAPEGRGEEGHSCGTRDPGRWGSDSTPNDRLSPPSGRTRSSARTVDDPDPRVSAPLRPDPP